MTPASRFYRIRVCVRCVSASVFYSPVRTPVDLGHFGIPVFVRKTVARFPHPPPAPLFWGVGGPAGAWQLCVRLGMACTPALQHPHHGDCEPLSLARPLERPQGGWPTHLPSVTCLGPQRDHLYSTLPQTLQAACPCSAQGGCGQGLGGIKPVYLVPELCL